MITLGGDAELELVDSLDPFTEGVVFSVRPPKKSWKNISNLSGGEKTLSSLALVSGTKIISLWIWQIALGTLFMYCRTLFANNKFANRSAHRPSTSCVHTACSKLLEEVWIKLLTTCNERDRTITMHRTGNILYRRLSSRNLWSLYLRACFIDDVYYAGSKSALSIWPIKNAELAVPFVPCHYSSLGKLCTFRDTAVWLFWLFIMTLWQSC